MLSTKDMLATKGRASFLGERAKLITMKPMLKAKAINKKIIIDKYSDKKSNNIVYQYLPQYL